MHIYRILSPEVLQDIDRAMEGFREKCIPVYAEAEKIRKRWIEQNIALEDIVAAIASRAGEFNAAVSLDQNEARHALMGDDSS